MPVALSSGAGDAALLRKYERKASASAPTTKSRGAAVPSQFNTAAACTSVASSSKSASRAASRSAADCMGASAARLASLNSLSEPGTPGRGGDFCISLTALTAPDIELLRRRRVGLTGGDGVERAEVAPASGLIELRRRPGLPAVSRWNCAVADIAWRIIAVSSAYGPHGAITIRSISTPVAAASVLSDALSAASAALCMAGL